MSILFRTKKWLSFGELVVAWSPELTGEGPDRERFERTLARYLLEDIINGRLDDTGPEVNGRRLGLRMIAPGGKSGFIEGHELMQLALSDTPEARSIIGNRVVLLKDAIIEFARRLQLPEPSWWADESRATSETQSEQARKAIVAKTGCDQPRRTLTQVTARVRGRKPDKFERVKEAMRTDLREGRYDSATLRQMLEKELTQNYGVSRDTARKARNAVLSEIVENSIRDK